ncbi:MAG: GNAT family N-acetyltransferase [Planctomycetota bacterium]
MTRVLEKFAKLKAQGYVRSLEIQFNRFIPPWIFRYSKGDIFEFDIEKLKSSASRLPADEDIELLCLDGSSDAALRDELRQFTWNSVPIETTANDFGYAIRDKRHPDKLLGGLWAGIGSFSENNLGIRFKFTDKQAWLYCAFVDSNARGRGIYKRLISFVAADLEQKGYTQQLGIVQPWNKISRAMHEKNSTGIVGRMSAMRIGPFVQIWKNGDIHVDRQLVTSPHVLPAAVSITGGFAMPKMCCQ